MNRTVQKSRLPSVSIVIPTLNSGRIIDDCLRSISTQEYPPDLVEILIADGGSSDDTLTLVDRWNGAPFMITHLDNPLQTGEAGKARGACAAKNELLLFLDSDNLLPDRDWLVQMVIPFEDEQICASEPLRYEYRRQDSTIDRYCALIGMNDPLCMFIGNYDRFCVLTNKWTGLSVEQEVLDSYIRVTLRSGLIPTIGANGFIIRRSSYDRLQVGDYLFDVDMVSTLVALDGEAVIAKVKTGIIHCYCSNWQTFIRKQRRRVTDYLSFNKEVRPGGIGGEHYPGIILFCLSCMTLLPLLVQTVVGYVRHPDRCWLAHPVACLLTFTIYTGGVIRHAVAGTRLLSRERWSQ